MNISLLGGWLPVVIQVLSVVALGVAIGRRSAGWLRRWLPVALAVGVAAAIGAYWFMQYHALADGPAPIPLRVWVALTGAALTVAIVGWTEIRWWRRAVALITVALCALCAALAVNTWTGYLPTVGALWNRTTTGTLQNQIDEPTALQMRQRGENLSHGMLVSVQIPSTGSGFPHRDELVYLPPSWFAGNPPPALPAVLMIGGEFGWPADWPSTGGAQSAADDFAAAHGGNTPILVFPDTSGEFSNDTECVNGPRGNAADHLIKDVVPYVISHFSASPDPTRWGVAGWSVGGTCAVLTTAMHPEMFTAFVDIDGLLGPNAGSKEQTIARLYGGNAAAYDQFDPATVLKKNAPYSGIAGLFAVSGDGQPVYRPPQLGVWPTTDPPDAPEDHLAIANYLCAVASGAGMECSVDPQPGDHKFGTAKRRFATSLPWLAGRLHTPGAAEVPLPGAGGG
ncbi:S-formylglutathione hydrolase FrmB [Mycobacterium sp. MAA66]|uniref:alpha/beta hydrolase n=1 Tax=Mycobacterium sp. MAA66 TaxID=3156297 RepID=UPI003516150A